MKCYHGSQKEGFCKDYHEGGCIRYDEPCDHKINRIQKGVIIYPHHCKKCGVHFTPDNAETNGYCFNCCGGDGDFELNAIKSERDHWQAEAEKLQKENKEYKNQVGSLQSILGKSDKKLHAMTALAEKYKGQMDSAIKLATKIWNTTAMPYGMWKEYGDEIAKIIKEADNE